MALLTIDITDSLKNQLDQEVATGRFKDVNTLIQTILEAGIQNRWKENVENKLDEALAEVERGEITPLKKGDCGRLGREYLSQKLTAKS